MYSISVKPKLSKLFRLQWEQTQNNYVLLYPEGMVKLNQSAAEILKRCDGEHDLAAIVDDLEKTFTASGLEPEIKHFLQVASERGWIS